MDTTADDHRPRRVALLTLDDRSAFVIDDDLAITELRNRGWFVEEIPWRRAGVDWRTFDLVVVRTTWDYQHDLDAFLAALEAIEATGTPLANPSALVRWNARKTYLRDLQAHRVKVVPTRYGYGLAAGDLCAICARLGPHGCVLKPTVSANAHDTFRVAPDLDAATDAQLVARFADREWMLQPFVRAVLDEGEYSLFYFDGAYSHAVVKRPKSGDFRVQEEHGGLIASIEPDAMMRATADAVMAALDEVPLQARVDLVRLDDGALALMELEAIEPSLYFRMHPRAAANFADALARYAARRPRLSPSEARGEMVRRWVEANEVDRLLTFVEEGRADDKAVVLAVLTGVVAARETWGARDLATTMVALCDLVPGMASVLIRYVEAFPDDRTTFLRAVEEFRPQSLLPLVRSYATHGDPLVRVFAVDALATIGGLDIAAFLTERFELESDELTRSHLATAVVTCTLRDLRRLAVGVLADPSEHVRANGVLALLALADFPRGEWSASEEADGPLANEFTWLWDEFPELRPGLERTVSPTHLARLLDKLRAHRQCVPY